MTIMFNVQLPSLKSDDGRDDDWRLSLSILYFLFAFKLVRPAYSFHYVSIPGKKEKEVFNIYKSFCDKQALLKYSKPEALWLYLFPEEKTSCQVSVAKVLSLLVTLPFKRSSSLLQECHSLLIPF
ncbi:Pleckstrin homology-like domain family B member 1 [Manis javanica]|nr:Pleckstrin homology-like domain family B member 1 [Manis javanica]